MYLLKIKGTDTIPDYIQIRDKNFTLISYFHLSNIEKSLQKLGLPADKIKEITLIAENSNYGVLIELKISN